MLGKGIINLEVLRVIPGHIPINITLYISVYPHHLHYVLHR